MILSSQTGDGAGSTAGTGETVSVGIVSGPGYSMTNNKLKKGNINGIHS